MQHYPLCLASIHSIDVHSFNKNKLYFIEFITEISTSERKYTITKYKISKNNNSFPIRCSICIFNPQQAANVSDGVCKCMSVYNVWPYVLIVSCADAYVLFSLNEILRCIHGNVNENEIKPSSKMSRVLIIIIDIVAYRNELP